MKMEKPWIPGWELTINEKGVRMATLPEQLLKNTLFYIEELEQLNNKLKSMTKKELVQIIKDNFADEDKYIDISGLDFEDYDVDICKIKTKGNLCQNSQKVGGNIFQHSQKVEGSIWQHDQEVGEDLYQSYQEVEGNIYQNNQKAKEVIN